MLRTVAPLRTARAVAMIGLVAMFWVGVASAAHAQDAQPSEAGATSEAATAEQGHGEAPDVSNIGTQNEVSSQYLPEKTDLPLFQRWMYFPLFIVGLLVVGMLLFRYLQWQPRFAEERRSKRRR